MEFSLADENNLGEGAVHKQQALLGATSAKEAWVESQVCHCPPAPIVCIKRTFTSITTSSQEKQGTGFRLLTYFQNENKTAFNLFTLPPTQRMQWTVKQNIGLQTSTQGNVVCLIWPFNMKQASCTAHSPQLPLSVSLFLLLVSLHTKEWDNNLWIKPKYKRNDLVTFRSGHVVSTTAGLRA